MINFHWLPIRKSDCGTRFRLNIKDDETCRSSVVKINFSACEWKRRLSTKGNQSPKTVREFRSCSTQMS